MMKSKGREGEVNVISKKSQIGLSSGTMSRPSSLKKKGKGKIPTNLKSKKKVADKGKYFDYKKDGHLKRNCP